MTCTLQTDNLGDFVFDASGSIGIARGLDAVVLQCTQLARAQRGEMLYQADRGLQTMALLWSGAPDVDAWAAQLRAAWLSLPDVTGIESLTVSREGDAVVYSARILTIYGGASLNG